MMDEKPRSFKSPAGMERLDYLDYLDSLETRKGVKVMWEIFKSREQKARELEHALILSKRYEAAERGWQRGEPSQKELDRRAMVEAQQAMLRAQIRKYDKNSII